MRDLARTAWVASAWACLLACSEPKNSDTPVLPVPSVGSGGGGGTDGRGTGGSLGGAEAGGAAGAAGASCSPADAVAPGIECGEAASIFASEVVAFSFGPGQDTGQDEFPELVLGAPAGKGINQGSVDGVVSLGNGGFVTLSFGENAIVDGPGPDFIVFENAFLYGAADEKVFAELATVSVSRDGEDWVEFPCSASEPPYGTCAGWHPVLLNGDEEDPSSLEPSMVGGDAFDLADVCLPYARFVKITDREDLDSALDGVFDLDAVGIVNSACDEP